MKDIIKLSLILGAVGVVSGFVLGRVNDVTAPRIRETEERILRESLGVVLPEAASFSARKTKALPDGRSLLYYEGYSAGGKVAGYALVGEKHGYQSLIRVLVGINPKGVIRDIKVLRQAETPGLGTRIDEIKSEETLWDLFAGRARAAEKEEARPWFQAQYRGLRADNLVVLKPPFGKKKGIHALTGATVTSRALTAAVRDSIEDFMGEGSVHSVTGASFTSRASSGGGRGAAKRTEYRRRGGHGA